MSRLRAWPSDVPRDKDVSATNRNNGIMELRSDNTEVIRYGVQDDRSSFLRRAFALRKGRRRGSSECAG